MTKRHTRALGAAFLSVLTAGAIAQGTAVASPPQDQAQSVAARADSRADNLPNPKAEAQRTLRQDAINKLITGEASLEGSGADRVIRVPAAETAPSSAGATNPKAKTGDRFVWYPEEREIGIFTILAEFGDQTKPVQGGDPGPARGQIEEPDRDWNGDATDNNSTYWKPNFDREHYQNMMFGEGNTVRDFYQKQSQGRFTVSGEVNDWVQLPYNQARYGHNPEEGDGTSEAEGYWSFVQDSVTAWYEDQLAQGKSAAEVAAYLTQFDKIDRYDYDGDGDFNETDGYIDSFQIIHAGEGEEAGGGTSGTDAIWSHRWKAFADQEGRTGPDYNKDGGAQIGGTGLWVADYTTSPENGGLGVFAHEFAHDIGLPDMYDTVGGDNGVGFWSVMAGGSWLSDGTVDTGTRPNNMGAWEKLQMGWLDYDVADRSGNYQLGQADKQDKRRPQAVAVPLPDKKVTKEYNTPRSGQWEWWSGAGNDLENTLTRTVDLTGRSTASMSAWLEYRIEDGYDYLFVQASTDGGENWTDLEVITGESGWANKTWDLTPFAGQETQVRFRYATDGGLVLDGAFIDDVTITADGEQLLNDDVESDQNGWTADGFSRITGSVTQEYPNYYLLENRVYSGYDKSLQTGPYNYGWLGTKPKWVERFPFQNGLLVWYVDTSYPDNNTRTHPGGGMALPVDARPDPIAFPDGALLSNRRQPWDATFGKESTDKVTFHRNGQPVRAGGEPAIPVFNDSDPNRYWRAANPWGSVKVAGSGTNVEVVRGLKQATWLDLKITRGGQ